MDITINREKLISLCQDIIFDIEKKRTICYQQQLARIMQKKWYRPWEISFEKAKKRMKEIEETDGLFFSYPKWKYVNSLAYSCVTDLLALATLSSGDIKLSDRDIRFLKYSDFYKKYIPRI